MLQFGQLLKRLIENDVEFIVIGGVAAALHGSPMSTVDLDVCAPMTDQNVERIHAAMQGISPRFRMRPDKMRLWDEPSRLHGLKNIYLSTDIGVIDILGELPGVGSYRDIADKFEMFEIDGLRQKVLSVDTLIAAKTIAGRDKDKAAVRHLQVAQKVKARKSNP